MATTIVVGNVKGGVGKSTTAIQLALHAGRRLERVVLLDTDPGQTTTSWSSLAGAAWPAEVATYGHFDHRRLWDALTARRVASADLVIVDTPHDPSSGTEVGPMLAAAIAAADLIVVPTAPDPADLNRLSDIALPIEAEQDRRADLAWCLALVRVDLRRRDIVAGMAAELVDLGFPVLGPWVPERRTVKEAFGTAEVLGCYGPMSDAVLDMALAGAVA